MSDESYFQTDGSSRFLNDDEKRLIRVLLDRSEGISLPDNWLDCVRVVPMSDGGMGSVKFLSSSSNEMASQIAEINFRDADGVEVVASLNADKNGNPFELDIWKVDFSPLIKIPDFFDEIRSGGNSTS